MIALVILGLGLLFIAAALPAGLEYTRQTVDLATAEAAADYAGQLLELNLRTSHRLYDWEIQETANIWHRLDNVHRPRREVTGIPGMPPRWAVHPTYEPFIKVRPLVTGNVRFGVGRGNPRRDIVDDTESVITAYLNAVGVTIPPAPLETDFDPSARTGLSLAENPGLPGLARVYPPVTPVTTFNIRDFFDRDPNDERYPTYAARQGGTLPLEKQRRELEKALDARVAWTAFYRRVAYDDPGPDSLFGTDDDIQADPLLYELIIVVTRRPTLRHRFPRQNILTGVRAFERPTAWGGGGANPPDDEAVGTDRLAPMPWLVIFSDPLPLLDPGLYDSRAGSDRTISTGFVESPTLIFHCTPEVGRLLPPGSVFIPAANDDYPVDPLNPGMPLARRTGFVPHAPDSVPIYEVIERPDAETVVVANNGYYPWVASGNPADTQAWPVWVIPPAFVERDGRGQPAYERQSPVIRVVRRLVRLHEVAP